MGEAAYGAVANGDKETLTGNCRVRKHADDGILQADVVKLQGCGGACYGAYVALHFGRLAQQHVHGHVYGDVAAGICCGGIIGGCACCTCHGGQVGRQVDIAHGQFALFGGNAHYGKGAAFALAQCLKLRQALRGNGQHVAFLAFIAPDFFGCHARLFQRHAAQVKACATACVIDQFRKGVRQAASAHVMNSEDGILPAESSAVVNHLLCAPLYFGVAALHGIEVQMGCVCPAAHGAGRTAAHANAHAGTAQLHQQSACGE